jgi:hypothetical protein
MILLFLFEEQNFVIPTDRHQTLAVHSLTPNRAANILIVMHFSLATALNSDVEGIHIDIFKSPNHPV